MPEAVLIQAMAVMPAADKALSLRGVDHLVLVTILADDPGEFFLDLASRRDHGPVPR